MLQSLVSKDYSRDKSAEEETTMADDAAQGVQADSEAPEVDRDSQNVRSPQAKAL
jgi:hypothetical protein